ncbi:MAG: hypothetical protein KA401_02985, partial [Anaerolineae bacterium]|nr:hypothetical protein [Anaerolineae bacterium]
NRNREKMSPKDEETLRRLLLGKGRFSVRLPNLGQPFDTHTQDAATSRSYRARLVVTDKNAKGYEKSLCLDLRKLIQAKYDPYDKDTRQVKHIVELDFTGVPDEEFRRAFCKNPGLRYVKPPLTQPLYLLEPLDLIHFSNGVPEQASAADLSATKPSVSDVNVASSGDQPIGSHV